MYNPSLSSPKKANGWIATGDTLANRIKIGQLFCHVYYMYCDVRT